MCVQPVQDAPATQAVASMHVDNADLAAAINDAHTAQQRMRGLLTEFEQEINLVRSAEERIVAIAQQALVEHDSQDSAQVVQAAEALQNALKKRGRKS